MKRGIPFKPMFEEFNGSPPTGTVTFLFTDIEESTALARNYPNQMPALLERHHTILRTAIQAQRGFVFQIIGDAFCAAFHTATDALNAALAAQRALQQEKWEPAIIAVRMGIHTGTAQAGDMDDRSGGYRGYLTLACVQRIMSGAHGGQILLSGASTELVRGQLPEGVSLLDLGEYRLKLGMQPDHLWQVSAEGLRAEFPALRSPTNPPNNLPVQVTAFIGREAELSEVIRRLSTEGVHLVTLTGPGGIGKTRMALQAAAELVERFEDGIYLIDLASIRDPESVPIAIGRTLGIREPSGHSLLDELKAKLREKKLLLLLDNFEQVTAAAPIVVELLQNCPNLKLLVTSREALRVRGEYVFPVPPLALPKMDVKHATSEQLSQYEAVRLFIERAQALQPDFTITNENAPAVAEICWRLDGLPLAIELATARIRLFSPQALLERLESRMQLLRGGARDLPARQQTLRGAIDWSYEMLAAGEQRLFQTLSVFHGCTVEAIEAVAERISLVDEFDVDILETVSTLVDKSLVRQVRLETGETRLVMLETIKEFAAERLGADDAVRADVRLAHATYYADLTQGLWDRLSGAGRDAALLELVVDIENARTAWDFWAAERNLEQLGKLVDSLWLLYDTRGWYQATINLTHDLLKVLSETPTTPELAQQEILLRTSLARATLAAKGYTPEVEDAYALALELSHKAGENPQLLPLLRGLYSFYTFRGEFHKGIPLGEKVLELAERYHDAEMHIEGHYIMGACQAFIGNIDLGLRHLDKSIAHIDPELHRSNRFAIGNFPGIPGLVASALLLWGLGFPDQALKRADEAVVLSRRINHPYSLAYALFHIGYLHLWRREIEPCLAYAQEVLKVAEQYELQIWHAVGVCLHGMGVAGLGKPEEGLAQIEHGMELYRGLKSPPIFWPLLRTIQARVCGMVGKPEQGLALLEEVLAFEAQDYGKSLQADSILLKGDLLLALSPARRSEAEMQFLRVLEIGKEQRSLLLELRAAISLQKLWQDTDKTGQGRELLQAAYEQFTEGFETVDLIEAKKLLESG
jgi:predicted ATPase/class 3 adenylate cyclase